MFLELKKGQKMGNQIVEYNTSFGLIRILQKHKRQWVAMAQPECNTRHWF